MAAFPGDYDDGDDEEFSHPLPPEDRLWRHPSEQQGGEVSLRLDPAMVRNRWLSSQPSRASAWTAGLVGALLATGLVVLGTHLATALTGRPVTDDSVTLTSLAPEATAVSSAAGSGMLGAGLLASVQRVGRSVVTVEASVGGVEVQALGLVIGRNGILTSAMPLKGASSVLVTMPGDEVLPAIDVLSDSTSGLAVLRVNMRDVPPVATLSGDSVAAPSLAIAVSAPNGTRYAVGDVNALDVAPSVSGHALVDALGFGLTAADSPPGSPVIDAKGHIIGLVAGGSTSSTAVVPAWLAKPIASQLMADGVVRHGWIGITGVTSDGRSPGVLVTEVASASAGAEAGITIGDVITAVNGRAITTLTALRGRLYSMRPGQTITVSLMRDGHLQTSKLRLDD